MTEMTGLPQWRGIKSVAIPRTDRVAQQQQRVTKSATGCETVEVQQQANTAGLLHADDANFGIRRPPPHPLPKRLAMRTLMMGGMRLMCVSSNLWNSLKKPPPSTFIDLNRTSRYPPVPAS